MGQKVNPVAFRVGVYEGWKSRWYAPKREFATLLVEDKKIRDYIKKHKVKEGERKGELSFPGVAKSFRRNCRISPVDVLISRSKKRRIPNSSRNSLRKTSAISLLNARASAAL